MLSKRTVGVMRSVGNFESNSASQLDDSLIYAATPGSQSCDAVH
jgi:hypothetical protein